MTNHMSPDEFKRHRETLGMTQEELAKVMGFNSGRAIRAYELGERVVSNIAAHFILALVKREKQQTLFDRVTEKDDSAFGADHGCGQPALHERYYGDKTKDD